MRYESSTEPSLPTERLGVLTRMCQIRVLNCSVSGCLLEANCRLDVGAAASIRVVINGREFVDDVQIVRCQPIAGAGSIYHIGAKFLWTHAPDSRSLRAAVWRSPLAMRPDDR